MQEMGIPSLMEEVNKNETLFNEEVASSLIDSPSLLDESDNMSFVEINNDVMSEDDIEYRKKYFSDPKNQAEILLQNYIKSQDILVNRQRRREIYKEFYRNAKKGKYKKLFSEQIYGISQEESKKNFKKLND